MNKYEYWAHRLFPKMKFSDVIEKMEKLGEKREVKVIMPIFLFWGVSFIPPQIILLKMNIIQISIEFLFVFKSHIRIIFIYI
jgi:hypothetical protein